MNDTEHLASRIERLESQLQELDGSVYRLAEATESLQSAVSQGIDAWKDGVTALHALAKNYVKGSQK